MVTIPILKSDVTDHNSFELLLNLYGCYIASVEDEYYIIEGSSSDIEDFCKYWSEVICNE